MPAALLITENLTRAFDARVAVRDLTLSVAAGEIVTVLGPNGAGKTTTMRMVAGLIPPSSGHITLNQVPLTAATADEARRSIGLLTEAPGLWERLSVRMNLLTYARLHGLPHPAQEVDAALARVGLADRAGDLAARLSKGLKQRVAIARALIHQPPIILLDEPTSGLDPASARQMRDLILDLRRQGRAVLVSTHNLAEAEELSDRIAVLNTSLLALDTPAALRRRLSGTVVAIELAGDAASSVALIDRVRGAKASAAGRRLTVALPDFTAVPDVVAALVAGGARVVRVSPDDRSLEEVYLNLVGPGQ
ncbi:MAG: heme ABC exporter ATP-binding protein CcmA [Acidobacteriota bacterium]|nr:heme ABC exporter ATP-binding protein CcmA [Acidobacteriota bacterium]